MQVQHISELAEGDRVSVKHLCDTEPTHGTVVRIGTDPVPSQWNGKFLYRRDGLHMQTFWVFVGGRTTVCKEKQS